MLGEEQGSPIEHAPPWSLFSDREIGRSFSDISPDESMATMINCGRLFPLPVSGVSVQQGSNLLPDPFKENFSGGFGEISDGYYGSDTAGSLVGLRSDKDQSGGEYSFLLGEAWSALQRFLPSNNEEHESRVAVDAYSCDEFRMYDFKVRRCVRGRSHDWTECPYAHPGEKARRRDPRKYHYSGTACPDFRKGSCKRGDNCEFAHGVFECWLHPARYRTQPCKDGTNCRRRVCFFAHTPEQLRVLPQSPGGRLSVLTNLHAGSAGDSYDGSPLRQALATANFDCAGGYFSKPSLMSSPTSTLAGHTTHSPPPLSPPLSPSISPPLSPESPATPSMVCAFSPHRRQLDKFVSVPANTMNVLASLRQLQLSKAKSASWPLQLGHGNLTSGFCSPRASSNLRPTFNSLPSTPTQANWTDIWESGCVEEEPVERVESGRDLRAKIFAKLSKQNSVEKPETPDVGWVSELVK